MTNVAIQLEEERLGGITDIEEYPAFHERHRVFPELFEMRGHRRVLDIAAGVGAIAKRISERYPAELICNDISPTCQKLLHKMGLKTVQFDIDALEPFPFEDARFDAVIATVTIEHVLNVEHFLKQIHRILDKDGCFYVSAPNYTGLMYLMRFLLRGKTFHDPMSGPENRYEFFAHVRYYTYNTMLEFVTSFGYEAEAVYLPTPRSSTTYQRLYAAHRLRALAYRYAMTSMYKLLPARWAAEPIICFRKTDSPRLVQPRKVIL